MGENQAHLTSDLPLRRMIEVLERASSEIRPALSAGQEGLLPRLRSLEARLEDLHRDVRSAERWLDEVRSRNSNDDEDGWAVAAAESNLEDALDRLRRGIAAMENVSDKVGRFKSAAADLDATTTAISRAKEYLREQIDALEQYRAVRLSAAHSNKVAPVASRSASPPSSDLPKLPTGFTWVPLDAISPAELEVDPTEWRKVDREIMKAGVKRLFEELVPLMLERSALNRTDFELRDAELGRVERSGLVHEHSLAHLYDVFFAGSEPIAGWRTPAGEWKLHNGRHRAKLAQELKFTHVPIKVTRG